MNRVALVVILCQSFKVTAAVNSPSSSSSSSPTSFLPPLLPSRSSPLRLFPLRRRRRFIDRSRNRARRPPTSVWRGGGVISGSTNLRQLVRHSLCQALLDGSPSECSKWFPIELWQKINLVSERFGFKRFFHIPSPHVCVIVAH